jgi:hypothetical protein
MFVILNVKMEAGMEVGVSVLHMRCYLRWKVFQALVNFMRIVVE